MSKKLGVYVCEGCGIGTCMDTQKLVEIASSENEVSVVRTSPAFCLEDSKVIQEDIERDGVDGVVIAACSPRVNTDVFRSDSASVERVNIREQVAWCQPPNHEETQSLADDYLRVGIVRAQKTSPPSPYTDSHERRILVIGGGSAGLAAAASAGRAGFEVLLVEEREQLGGYAARLHLCYPQRPPYHELASIDIETSIQEAASLPNVRMLVGAEIVELSGQPGHYDVTIRTGAGDEQATVGAIVVATGWVPGDPARHEVYGLGVYPDVVTTMEVEEMAQQRAIRRPSDGGPVKRVAFVVCDTGADDTHLPYGGSVWSLVALKQALYVRDLCPDSIVYLFYGDMQTPGQHEYFYKRVQDDPQILFTCGEIRNVRKDDEGLIVFEADQTVVGGQMEIAVDLLVLSADMIPTTFDFPSPQLLNLQYQKGKELPTNKFGFADSNFICFPYETERTGIYAAGAVRQSMDLAASAQDGTGAALKAIQCIERSSEGEAVHPRVHDLSYPEFFMQKCTSCGRCSQECPFSALEVDDNNHPVLEPNRCRRCGICMGACPVQIISFNDYSVDMLSSMINAVEIPEDDEDKPRILIFACENDAYPALDMAGIARSQYPACVRVIPVRCLGSVNSVLVADAVSRGFDGVALLGCKAGEDYQCHFIHGSELLDARMDNVRETLGRLALESERVKFMEIEITDSHRIPGLLEEFVDTIKQVGPNPFKGF
tara:strand:+ start:6766 stop:8910 length:2145 start_codon:yes stop_codon:yes gene_type:complete